MQASYYEAANVEIVRSIKAGRCLSISTCWGMNTNHFINA
jgi:hypothetical protein